MCTHCLEITSVCFCPSGDIASGAKLHVFRGQKRRKRGSKREGRERGREKGKGRGRGGERVVEGGTVGHVGYILALAVSSDGTYLVSELMMNCFLFSSVMYTVNMATLYICCALYCIVLVSIKFQSCIQYSSAGSHGHLLNIHVRVILCESCITCSLSHYM